MTGTNGRDIRILLVDDDPRECGLVHDLLSRIYDDRLRLDYLGDSDRALEVIARDAHDLCLIDCRMPGRDGLRLIRAALGTGCAMPLILLTGCEDRKVDIAAMQAGAADCLIKSQLDVTTMERSLRHALQRARSAVDLRRAKEEAEQSNRTKDRLLAMVSHELRTPLTPVLMAVSALLDGDGDGDGDDVPEGLTETLELVRRNVELQSRLIDDLMDLSRVECGKFRLDVEEVDLHESIRRALEICRDEIARGGLSVRLDLRATDPRVAADPSRLLQIAWNLITNAARYAPGGELTIRTSHRQPPADGAPRRLVVEFIDDGPGIAPDALPRIFEPFEQGAPDDRERPLGLGLGLTICRALARAHGGDLEVSSPHGGRGTTFRFELDSPDADPDPAAGPVASAPAGGIDDPRPDGLRILLVEDNRDALRYLALVLGRSHRVTAASSLDEARGAAADGRRFDLLICDLELPDGNGMDLMRELGSSRDLPGIALSGYGSPEDVEESLGVGFTAHLTKPIDSARLLEAVGRTVGSRLRQPVLASTGWPF